jgi:hypothetical protein
MKDALSEEDSEYSRLDVPVEKEVLVVKLVSSTVEDDVGVNDGTVVDDGSVEPNVEGFSVEDVEDVSVEEDSVADDSVVDNSVVEASKVDDSAVEASEVDASEVDDSVVEASVVDACVVDVSVVDVVELVVVCGVAARAKINGNPEIPFPKDSPDTSLTMASGTNGFDPVFG